MIYLPEHPAVWVLIFAVGAVIGSFLNVVIYRSPQRESIVRPPSHCMSCGARLGFVDLIPIVSYLMLRGRCRHCHHRFSPRYAVVELITGLLLVGSLGTFALSWYGIAVFLVCCCLVLVFFIDLDHLIIPDELVVIIAVVGIALNLHDLIHFGVGGLHPNVAFGREVTHALAMTQRIAGSTTTLYLPTSLVGLFVGGGVFLFVSWVFERVFGKPVLGFGDVKLAAAMGALLGPGCLFIAWFLISVVVGAVVAVALLVLRVRKRRDYIPFGPMLAAGGIALLLYPEVGAYVVSLYGF